ncbi:MAG: SurA N-terminal domain-containing protein [Bacteroidia bacterium]
MSILERIRKNSAIAVGAIGLALALFVITDALNSNTGIFGAGKGNKNNVAEIDGNKISIKQFQAKIDENEENYKERQQQKSLDQNAKDMIREQTWNQVVQEELYGKEYDQLGLSVCNDELADMFYGENIHPQVRQSFTDPKSGNFDKNVVLANLKRIEQGTDEKVKKQVKDFEDFLVKDQLTKKYNSLLKKGFYATSLEAKAKYADRKNVIDFDYIALPFQSVADSTVKIDESELKSFFKKNQDKYKEKEDARKLSFVLFDVIPTKEDTDGVNKWVKDQVGQFADSKNDTLYVDLNSDSKFDTVAKPFAAFPEDVQNRIATEPLGSVIGPVYNNGKFSIYKISGIKEDSIYQMRASHILFKTENGDTAATIKKANSVMKEIAAGASFAEMAAKYGTDGTASRGGDLGWFREGQMVKQFNDAVLKGKKGSMQVLKTQFGVHILKVTEEKTRKLICAGVLERTITASEKTVNMIYSKASAFAAGSQTAEEFEKNITEKNYTKRTADNIHENEKAFAGLNDAREVVRWAFNAKRNDISEVFSIGEKYIVAMLVGVKEKGKSNLEDVKEVVENDFRKDKKAELLSEKANKAMSGLTKLQDIAAKLQLPLSPYQTFMFENSNIPYIGMDNVFCGTVAGTKTPNKILGPVKGDGAVYIFMVKKLTPAPETKDLKSFKDEIQSMLSQKAESMSFDALKEIRKVTDNRASFF